MVVAGLVLCSIGALIHGYVFWLESIAWRGPRARRVFGTTEEEARVTAPLALNQGFYNLFLAVEVLVGVVLLAVGLSAIGATAVLIGAGSMTLAGVVLIASDRTKARPALIQALPPGLGVVLLALGLLLRA